MEKFWVNVSIKIDKFESPLAIVGLASLLFLCSSAIYFVFINSSRNEVLFLCSVLSIIILFISSGFGLVKYIYFGKYAKIHEASEFMKTYASLFLTFWFCGLLFGAMLVSYKLIKQI
jgi:hypothetical protein